MIARFCLVLGWLLIAGTVQAAAGAKLDQERQRFQRAYDEALAGHFDNSRRLAQGLEDYPLYQYLRYQELRPRLTAGKDPAVVQFLLDYPGSYLAARLRTDWLRLLGRAQRWQTYLDVYQSQQDPSLRCWHLQARLALGRNENVLDEVKALWLVGQAQPGECDPVFQQLLTTGVIDDELIWSRIHLALQSGQTGLAQFLAKKIAAPTPRLLAGILLEVHQNPAQGLQHPRLRADSPQVREIIRHGIERLAQQDVDTAISRWTEIKPRYQFTDHELALTQRTFALAAAATDHPDRLSLLDAVPAEVRDERVNRYQLREGLKSEAWETLARWTEQPPVDPIETLRWRYWHAKSLEALGRSVDATAQFQALAIERDYYGFLASDHLGLPYTMNDKPIAAAETERAAIAARPGIRRAQELYLLGLRLAARQELHFELAQMKTRDIEVAAEIVFGWGWYDRAIFALGRSQSYDDLGLRFPTVHKELVAMFAQKYRLDPALIFSIIRGESAFMVDARSPAGALGLMQLMPATGIATARRAGLALKGPQELLAVDKNIALGSQYLKQVLDQFGGKFYLAAAAYNAGPERVKSWLPKSGCMPADIWIDTIPYTETRMYVRRALFYAAIYEWRLGQPISPLSSRLMAAVNLNANQSGQC